MSDQQSVAPPRPQSLYNEDDTMQAVLALSLITAEQDNELRRQKYGDYATCTTTRSHGGSPALARRQVTTGISRTPTVDAVLCIPSTASKSGPPSPSIARPRPNSRTFSVHQPTNSQPQSTNTTVSTSKPTIPPRPAGYPQRPKVVANNAPPQPRVGQIPQQNKLGDALDSGGGQQDLISLSPVGAKSHNPLDFDLSTLDPLSDAFSSSQLSRTTWPKATSQPTTTMNNTTLARSHSPAPIPMSTMQSTTVASFGLPNDRNPSPLYDVPQRSLANVGTSRPDSLPSTLATVSSTTHKTPGSNVTPHSLTTASQLSVFKPTTSNTPASTALTNVGLRSEILGAYPSMFPPVSPTTLSTRQSAAPRSLGLGPVPIGAMHLMPNQSYGGGVGAAVPSFPYLASNDPLSALHDDSPMGSNSVYSDDGSLILGSSAASFATSSNKPDVIKDTNSSAGNSTPSSGLSAVLIPTPVSNSSLRFSVSETPTPSSSTRPLAGSTAHTPVHVAHNAAAQVEAHHDPDDLMYFASDYESIHDYLTLECFDPLFNSKFIRDQEVEFGTFKLRPTAEEALPPVESSSANQTEAGSVYAEIDDFAIESNTAEFECGLQDPFSADNLSAALASLEEKRRKYAEEQEVIRQQAAQDEVKREEVRQQQVKMREKPARPTHPPLCRRASCLAKGQEYIYELLQHHPETADEEIHAFCRMVTRLDEDFIENLRLENESGNIVTNKGFVVSPRVTHPTYKDISVKLIVNVDIIDEPVVFTCDLSSSVDHVISHVLLSLSDDATAGDTQYSFVLQVLGLSEYLISDTILGDYAYIQTSLKIAKDIRLVLVNVNEIPTQLHRTVDDDNQLVFVPRSMMSEELIKRDSINILVETFYGEIEKLRDLAIRSGLKQASPGAVLQSVKAICAMLCRVTSIELIKAISKLQAFSIDPRLQAANPVDREAYLYVTEDGTTIPVVSSDTASCMNDLHQTLEHLTVSVKGLIELFCRTFHTDYRFLSAVNMDREIRLLDSLHENFIIHIASCHRIPEKWKSQFVDFKVMVGIYHGGRSLCNESVTQVRPQLADFVHNTLIWDEWVMFDSVFLHDLPREARLCLTLVGVKVVTSGSHDTGQRVTTPLGWVALQLFDYNFDLVQGSQLLGLWPGEVTQPTGTSQSNTDVPNSVLIQVNLPDFECRVPFPDVPRLDLVCQQDFTQLHPNDQELLHTIIEKDVLTRLTRDELDCVWQRRHFLTQYPAALCKFLLSVPTWCPTALVEVYSLLDMWAPLSPLQAVQLLLPGFADTEVRNTAVRWVSAFSTDELADFLPQFVQALKFESYHTNGLVKLLLERSTCSIRFSHQLYWLLKEAAEDVHYRKRYQLMLGALLSVVGHAVRKEFSKQEDLSKMLSSIAEKVKAAKDKEGVLHTELSNMWDFLPQESIRLPINPSMEIQGTDIKSCSYFPSNAFPLKLVFCNIDQRAEPVYSMFKVGDDLRQDMLTMQLINIMDRLWLSEGLDLKIVTFKCQATGFKKGLVELVTESETLRKIQIKQGQGITGSFKDRPIAKWLQMQNATELDYQNAVANFTASCAGYCVATYILGIMDRHNDNIMVKQSGHLFHIDFGKYLGDAQMFGNFKRDRVPFVLTSDMVYVINDGDKPTHKFQNFVDLCCRAFNIMRRYANLFLTLFSMMIRSGIPGVSASSAQYVQKALMRDRSDIEATAAFTALINHSMKSFSTQVNFFIHNLAQMKFSGHSEGVLLSFIPKTYSIQTDGRISSVEVFGYQKRYNPEKYYIFIIKVSRDGQRVDSFIFRRYSEVQEFQQKLTLQFSLTTLPPLTDKVVLGRTHVQSVAEVRKCEIERFLRALLSLSPEVAESDMVYTFFHPMLRDEQDIDKTNLQKLKDKPVIRTQVLEVQGALKLAVFYKSGCLTVMVMHASQLAQLNEPPDPYVKAYLLPDVMKTTKRKTKIAKSTPHPTYNEMLQYRMPLEEAQKRVLQLTVWSYHALQENAFLGAVYIKLDNVHMQTEAGQWYQLQNLNQT